jgi:hypothetical protein
VLRGCYKEYSKLLCVEVIDSIHVLQHQSLVHEGWGITKHGGGSPCQNLTFLKNISLVSLPRSRRTKG